MPNSYNNPTVERMSHILDILLAKGSGITAAELLRSLDIPKTTLYRILYSMTENGFLTYLPESSLYLPGDKFTTCYISMDERVSNIRKFAEPHMHSLASQIQETVKLCVLSGMKAYTISSVKGTRPIHINIGNRAIFPLHTGASGKVLMCSLSENQLRNYFALYAVPYTDKTIVTLEEMTEELSAIRKKGFATDHGEYMTEINAVAVPIYGEANQIIAALSIVYHSASTYISESQLTALLQVTASKISSALKSTDIWEHPVTIVQKK